MLWLPTMAPYITGIETVRLASKGFSRFSASNPQKGFGTFPLELDDIIIISWPTSPFNTVANFYMAYTFRNNGTLLSFSDLLLK